jgi:hypothetical protein
MVITARGTGEDPLSGWGSPAKYSKKVYYGAGPELYEFYSDHLKVVRPHLTFSLEPVMYPVPNLSYLKNLADFESDARIGGTAIVADIERTDTLCRGTVKYVLGGYSEGAWAVHDALNDLTKTELGEIAGVAMFGDPKFEQEDIVREYKSNDTSHGIGAVEDKKDNAVPAAIAPRTGSWCLPDDPICQASRKNIAIWLPVCIAGRSSCPHFHYVATGATSRAAAFLAPFLPAATASSWHAAAEIAGLAALDHGGAAALVSVSCAWAGYCTAGGYYTDPSGDYQPFVADEVNGEWKTAIEVPGIADLNFADAMVNSVSCASPGNCAVGGYYTDGIGYQQAFIADEVNGEWKDAIEVPGTDVLNELGAMVESVSCASPGNCTLGGYYTGYPQAEQAFVAEEVNGRWDNAYLVPATYGLSDSKVYSVSCSSAGDCAIGGYYTDKDDLDAFVAVEVNGSWGNAVEVPGISALSSGASQVESVSCASRGNCTAGGYYTGEDGSQAFVADEVNGSWRNAIGVPRAGALSNGAGEVDSVSCASAGNCVAGGDMSSSSGLQAFIADEVSGVWQDAIEVPGVGALNDGSADVFSVSCASAGNCAAGGQYTDSSSFQQAFVADEVNGEWKDAIKVAPTDGSALVESVSCAWAGDCAAVGYMDTSSGPQAIVADEVSGP